MPSQPPNSQSNPTPLPGQNGFRVVSPESGEIIANTDNVKTVITGQSVNSFNEYDNLVGQRLGHFEVLETIGAGGMATVLRARDVNLGRIVALKILPQTAAIEPELLARFQQEARSAAILDDEHIARVYYFGEDGGLYFIAFEYVQGQNLKELIESNGAIPVPQAVDLMLQVAQGLAHAAKRGVIHRDLKPSNIIVDPLNRAKIVDMGLARCSDVPADNLTQSGVTMGTYDYVAPEQALDARSADIRSDIYSLGCTFYHALTGRPPVPDGTAAFKLNHHQNVQPADPRTLNSSVPSDVVAILARMMHKVPSQRYPCPEDLIHDLSAVSFMAGFPLTGLSQQTLERAPTSIRASLLIYAISILAVVALVVLTQRDQAPDPPLPGHFHMPRLIRGDKAHSQLPLHRQIIAVAIRA